MPYVVSRIGADTADALQIHDDQLDAVVTRWDYRGRRVAAAAAVPSVAAGTAAGTGATATVTGDDSAHRVTVTCGSTGMAAGMIATMTLSAAFTNAPFVAVTPRDAGSAALQVFVTSTGTTIALHTNATPTPSTTYTRGTRWWSAHDLAGRAGAGANRLRTVAAARPATTTSTPANPPTMADQRRPPRRRTPPPPPRQPGTVSHSSRAAACGG